MRKTVKASRQTNHPQAPSLITGGGAKKDRREARAWMVLNSIQAVEIKRALGLKSHSQVILTLNGIRDDKRVLSYLIDRGCPEKYLELPSKMKRAA